MKITGTSFVANRASAARSGGAVDRGNSSNLARRELRGWGGGGKTEDGNDDGEGVHVDDRKV
jgi:hypothetical protein